MFVSKQVELECNYYPNMQSSYNWLISQPQYQLKYIQIQFQSFVKYLVYSLEKLQSQDGDNLIKPHIPVLAGLNDSAKAGLVKKVTDAVKNGKIANVKIIRLLEEQLGIELMQLV